MPLNTVKHDAGNVDKHYTPINKEKYVGVYPIVCRSQWERAFCMMVDTNINVVQWASEPYRIPYNDPVSKQQKIYIPDFMISVKLPNGTFRTKVIEIKPSNEAISEAAITDKDKIVLIKNMAKWGAAKWWCQRRGADFVIMTEHELFGPNYASPKKKPLRGVKKPKAPKTVKPIKSGTRKRK